MSDPLTEERLAEILARTDAATPPPWVDRMDGWTVCAGEEGPKVCSTYTSGVGIGVSTEEQVANSEFIAAARADVPDLVAEVCRQREELAAVRNLLAERDRLRAVLARVLPLLRDAPPHRSHRWEPLLPDGRPGIACRQVGGCTREVCAPDCERSAWERERAEVVAMVRKEVGG